jgi:hypothetical protein
LFCIFASSMPTKTSYFSVLFLVMICFCRPAKAQRYLSDLDTSHFINDTLRPFLKRFENLHFSGYIQPQFQVAQEKGASSYAGGNFSTYSNSRFMLRRARMKMDYYLGGDKKLPKALFSFQIDATERGVNVRDMFVRLYATRNQNFSLTAGLFSRPFGYELNLSSAYRETPERGRMSQILMPTERDLGAMISYEPHPKDASAGKIKLDAGIFNGQGLAGTTDFDSYKDFISRLTIRPVSFQQISVSGGLSLLYGGWRQSSKYVYELNDAGDNFNVDSSQNNIGKNAPRHYYGADIQVVLKHGWGETEWRAEYWTGVQPGTANSTVNPGIIAVDNNSNNSIPLPVYIRKFNGAFFYFLQNIINNKHQLLLKYDWYDPNKKIKESVIGTAGKNFTQADIKYATVGFGYAYYMNEHVKFIFYYDKVSNKTTALPGFTTDLKDDIFTCRMQLRF